MKMFKNKAVSICGRHNNLSMMLKHNGYIHTAPWGDIPLTHLDGSKKHTIKLNVENNNQKLDDRLPQKCQLDITEIIFLKNTKC